MELNWTTFLLEIGNFLVLVWILTRLLYRPILHTIAQRTAAVQHDLAEAERLRREAHDLQIQYEHRQADWTTEAERMRGRMVEDVQREKRRLLDELQASIQQEREKAAALEERRLMDLRCQVEEAAVMQGGLFASKLLTRLAHAELEARLVSMLLEDLRELDTERRQAIRSACAEDHGPVVVTSAHHLTKPQRDSLAEAVQSLLGQPALFEWQEDPRLLAGVRALLGPWMLQANLQDELRFFSEGMRTVSSGHGS